MGATYSTVAILQENGKPAILPNIEGQNITFSVVLLPDAASGSDAPLVGDMTKHSGWLYIWISWLLVSGSNDLPSAFL